MRVEIFNCISLNEQRLVEHSEVSKILLNPDCDYAIKLTSGISRLFLGKMD